MSVWRRVRAWVSANLRRSRMESEMDAELRFHIEARAEDLMRGGMARAEALRRARIEFGGMDKAKEECREARGVAFLEGLVQDLRFGLRMLRKGPGFTAVAVLTLALGIGANAAIFNVINAILLRPLAVERPGELVAVGDPGRVHSWSSGTPRVNLFSYPLYREVEQQNEVFSSLLSSANLDNLRIVIEAGTEGIHGRMVSGNYFQTLGVGAIAGRTFTAQEDRVAGRSPVAVISYGYWQRRFAGNREVVGRTVRLNGYPFTIIGVAEPGFYGEVVEDQNDLWTPLTMQGQLMAGRNELDSPNNSFLLLMGRLRQGVTLGQAQANLNTVVKRALTVSLNGKLSADDRSAVEKMKVEVPVSPGGRGLSGVRQEFSTPLLLLMGMVALVLLVACINVANLMLARATVRQREMAVRFAMGAGTGRVIRQLLTESLVLVGLGGGLGLLLAKWGARGLIKMADAGNGVRELLSLDWRVLGFTGMVCVAAALAFGLGPAWRFAQVKVATALKEGSRDSGSRGRGKMGRLLLSTQIAVGVFVLMGASLLVRSLRNLQEADLGYSREKLLLVRVDAGASRYRDAAIHAVTQELLTRLEALPGVRGVTASSNGLYSGSESSDAILLDGAEPSTTDKTTADDEVGPNYFSTIGAPIVLGREITREDYSKGAQVAVVNEAFVKYYFAERNPIGHSISIQDSEHPNAPPYEIVGVAKDVRDHHVREEARRRMYAPLTSATFDATGAVNFEILAENPGALVNSVRSAIRGMNPDLIADDPKTANRLVGDTLNSQALVARLSALFGGLVLILVCIGLYGSMAYNVAMRTKEIGLRMALGIPRGAVMWMVAREAWILLAIGLTVGVPLGIAGSRLLRAMLFEVGAGDPISIVWAIVALAGVGVGAAVIPARRATRVDPMVALRSE